MSDDGVASGLAQLKQAYEAGILDEQTYTAPFGCPVHHAGRERRRSPAVAQRQRMAALPPEERGVAVAGDVHGNIYLGRPTDDPDKALGHLPPCLRGVVSPTAAARG